MDESRVGYDATDLQREAARVLEGCAEGAGLEEHDRTLIRIGVASSTTALDLDTLRREIDNALAVGVTPEEITEVFTLVAALGMHTLHEGIRELRAASESHPSASHVTVGELDDQRLALRAEYEGDSSYWRRLDAELPGFLDGLLRLSPETYRGFFEFCALAPRHGTLPPRTRELVYLAIDATPTHRYGPGFRLHLANALKVGASRRQIEEALDIGLSGGPHRGIR